MHIMLAFCSGIQTSSHPAFSNVPSHGIMAAAVAPLSLIDPPPFAIYVMGVLSSPSVSIFRGALDDCNASWSNLRDTTCRRFFIFLSFACLLLSGFPCVVALVHHYSGPPLLPLGLSVWPASVTLSGCPCF